MKACTRQVRESRALPAQAERWSVPGDGGRASKTAEWLAVGTAGGADAPDGVMELAGCVAVGTGAKAAGGGVGISSLGSSRSDAM